MKYLWIALVLLPQVGMADDDAIDHVHSSSFTPAASATYLTLDETTGDITINGVSIWDMEREEVRRVVKEIVKIMNEKYIK